MPFELQFSYECMLGMLNEPYLENICINSKWNFPCYEKFLFTY